MEKLPSMWDMPNITFDWKEFKDCSDIQRHCILDAIIGVAKIYWIVSDGERKKIHDRVKKKFNLM